jgi:hypothetical protein
MLDLMEPVGPEGGRAAFDGWHRAMKPDGRRAIMGERRAWSCCHSIFFVRPAHHDLERIIRQRPLQRLRLISRRAHPQIALFVTRLSLEKLEP